MNTQDRPKVQELTDFLVEYATTMIGVGTYTSRVARCVERIALAYGYEVNTSFLLNHTYISVMDIKDHSIRRTYIANNKDLGVDFHVILRLSSLSWSIYDHNYSLSFAKRYFKKAISKKKRSSFDTVFFVSLASSAFCGLFGGELIALIIVFFSTLIGASLRTFLSQKKVDLRLIYLACSFLSSFLALYASSIFALKLAALSASTLYLVPGVFFINVSVDILKNNIIMGISRLVNVSILIICIAIGIYASLALIGP